MTELRQSLVCQSPLIVSGTLPQLNVFFYHTGHTVYILQISQDPLVHHGCHFCRAVHAFCNMQMLIMNGLHTMSDDAPEDETLPAACIAYYSECKEHIQKGANGTRADDTKGMKGLIIDWITPKGQSLIPHIHYNVKSGCGFNHVCTGALLCPAGLNWNNLETCTKLTNGEIQVAGDQWPMFLYANYMYDPEDPWNGLLCSGLLISIRLNDACSVDQEPKATCSGNAHIHSMCSMMKVSLAYITTQVFSCTDLMMDCECFYNSILELLNDPDEKGEVDQLMAWWNHQVFALYSDIKWFLSKNSALSRICAKMARKGELVNSSSCCHY
ncbi:hypothetical protein J3A83DRAFT_4362664 [Scleroderma citrinum]